MPVLMNNQNEKEYYMNQLGVTEGNIVNLERDFLYQELSVTTGNVTDMWIKYLQANGATSDNMTKAWREFLLAAGYSHSNLQDDMVQYFIDNS